MTADAWPTPGAVTQFCVILPALELVTPIGVTKHAGLRDFAGSRGSGRVWDRGATWAI
jgi:hypothetical protein